MEDVTGCQLSILIIVERIVVVLMSFKNTFVDLKQNRIRINRNRIESERRLFSIKSIGKQKFARVSDCHHTKPTILTALDGFGFFFALASS